MDPLSVAATAITMAGIVIQSLKQAKALRDAPADIDRLVNAVSELQLVLIEMQKMLDERSLTEDASPQSRETDDNLSDLLGRTAKNLGGLQTIADKSVSSSWSSSPKYSRIAWLRNKSAAEDICKELQSLKLSLSAVLAAGNSVQLYRIQNQLERHALLNRATLVERTVSVADRQRVPDTPEQGIEPDYQHQAAETSNSQLTTPGCLRCCSCACHKPLRLDSPASLRRIIGAFSIDGGFVRIACSEKMCKRRQSGSVRITYRLPSWLMATALTLYMKSSPAGPQLSLQTLRVLPRSAEIFHRVCTGDIQGVKNMFQDGTASIYDIDDQRWSLTHKAFLVGHVDMCSFLIEQGADINIVAENGSSIVQRAWVYDRTLSKLQPENANLNSRILSLTDMEDMVESNQYSVFHKIVLKLSKLDLEAQLEHSTATIDQLDSDGMSPLWWASARGDTEAVRLLLSHGASVTTPEKYGHGDPLHIAANPEIIHLLLEHGADVEARDAKGRTPLHVFSYKGPNRGGSANLLEAILERSADPNLRAPAGHTALGSAAMYGLVDYIHLLVRWGASLDVGKYADGFTPLLDAVRHCHADAVEALLEHGANYFVKSSRGETMLHLCARYADCATMDVLVEAGMSGLDLDARDGHGMTARDCFAARRGKTAELERAMEDIYASIRKDG